MFLSFLDNDLYKLLMSQFVYYYYPEALVTYKFTNRGNKLNLDIDTLKTCINQMIRFLCINDSEMDYLKNLTFSSFYTSSERKVFSDEFLYDLKDKLENNHSKYPGLFYTPVIDEMSQQDDELSFTYTGVWWTTILFEVPFLAEISEMHTRKELGSLYPDINFVDKFIREFNKLPNSRSIRFSDFGTRRRQTFESHFRTINYLLNNLPDTYNLGGTSNMHFAKEFNLNPVGTFAHELPMVISGILEREGKDPRNVYPILMDQWSALYKGAYSILLPDTFGSYWLFDNFPEQVLSWEGVRHDSGDPFYFGDYYINLCEQYNIDPMSKVIVFSDSLTPKKMQDIFEYFQGRVWVTFGVGTNLTHNTYVDSPDIVIKTDKLNDSTSLVKLSDEKGKYTGDRDKIDEYLKLYGYE